MTKTPKDEDQLTVSATIIAVLTALFATPTYVALALLICRGLTGFRGFSEWAYLINGLFALLTEPIAMFMGLLAAVLPIGKKGKTLVWEIAGGSVVAWIITRSMNPSSFS